MRTPVVVVALVGTLAALPAAAAVYWVDQTLGNDSHAGTETLPWATIQHAADTLVAGDTVFIRTGVYLEQVTPLNSGDAGSIITYAAAAGHTPTLDGAGLAVAEDEGLFNIGGASHIRVSGLRVVNSDQSGIRADGASHVTIDHNSTYNTATSGIGAWGCSDVLIEGNRVEHACTGIWQECISVGGCTAFTVRDNHVLDCGKEGICLKDGATGGQVYGNLVDGTGAVGIYVDSEFSYTSAIAVFGNVVHAAGTDGIALASEAGTTVLQNVQVANNVVYGSRFVGLALYPCDWPPCPLHDITIVNNTFADNGWEWGGGIAVDCPDIQNVVIRNNISSQNQTFQLVVGATVPTAELTVDHNLIDGPQGEDGATDGDAAVVGPAGLVDASGGDFHLRGDSLAVDHGVAALAPAVDFDGTPRPQGSSVDIGAFEWGAIFFDGFESGATSAWSAAVP